MSFNILKNYSEDDSDLSNDNKDEKNDILIENENKNKNNIKDKDHLKNIMPLN
jgi:hypothetical protein